MKRLSAIATALLLSGFTLFGCTNMHDLRTASEPGWISLFDGTNLNNWELVGNANWRLMDGVVQADLGNGNSYLVSKKSYTDFKIRAEFWVDAEANSGIFIRCTDPKKITATNAYEVNIYDQRPDPSYGTGAIVNVAKVSPMPKAGGHWNYYEITAKGPEMSVTLNGIRTVDAVRDSKNPSGPIALQWGGGVVKFRKVEILPL